MLKIGRLNVGKGDRKLPCRQQEWRDVIRLLQPPADEVIPPAK
jgi:hypothetical protein